MADIRETRRKLIIALVVLLVLDVGAVAVLLSPIGTARSVQQQELAQLQSELQTKTREVAPLQGIDQKVDEAKQQVHSFFDNRLPSHYSQIVDELGKIAQASHVQFSNVRYSTEDTDIRDVRRVAMEGNLAGDYTQVVRFINALERSKMLFLVDAVTLGEEQGGNVRLTIRLETYMKAGTA